MELSSRLEYFPEDFDQSLMNMEMPYYQYEFEREKKMMRRKGGQMDG